MECKKETCGKIFTKAYSCSRCDLKFCSSSCMIDHFFIKHEIESQDTSMTKAIKNYKLSELKNNKRNSANNFSLFIKKGEILKDIRLDSYFNFDNFEKVKMGNKLHLLGTGAFGEVYLVKNRRDGKLFAVKQMNKSRILSTGATLEIIRREIDIHCRLIHENIIRLYSFSEDDNSFYLLMEYADSGNLFRKIRKSKGLDEKSAFKYFIQTAAAIYFIHENNMIHRDIKPENLLLDDKDNIKLCDFGWCIELEIGNRNTICGTPEYMAPEIIKEMPYDKSIDIWSLGVLLYELLHGYSPFRSQNENDEEDNTQVMRNILKYNLTFDRKDLSDPCCNIITSKIILKNIVIILNRASNT
jgi:serine/threonine protein kinase